MNRIARLTRKIGISFVIYTTLVAMLTALFTALLFDLVIY